jgi:hypothetical protein
MPSLRMDVSYTLPAVENSVDNKAEATPEIQSLSFEEYMVIAGENTFHPDRIMPVEKVEKKEEKAAPPLPKPEIVLYGTLISDDLSLAYIEDVSSPITSPGRGKRVRVIKKGADIGGFILKEIKSDMIVLVRGEEIMTVNLAYPIKKRESFSPQTSSPPKSSN